MASSHSGLVDHTRVPARIGGRPMAVSLEGALAMTTLHITKLECIKKRDLTGKDDVDIYVSVDGGPEVWLAGPILVDKSKNRVKKLNETRFFTDVVKVRLKERNGSFGGSNDLILQTVLYVHSDEKPNHIYDRNFISANKGVEYCLSYKITP
jgi:hypothetical protein